MKHQIYMHGTETIAIVIFAVVLWIFTLINTPVTDTVSLYYLETSQPDFNALQHAFEKAPAGASAAAVSMMAWYMVNETCLDPNALTAMIHTGMSINVVATNGISMPMTYSYGDLFPVDPANSTITAKSLQAVQSRSKYLVTSGLCKCLLSVLNKFNSLPASSELKDTVPKANSAFRSCFSTNQHAPRQTLLQKDNYNKDVIKTRKTMSKVSFVLIIAFSLLFNFMYQQLKFEDANNYFNSWNIGFIIGLTATAGAQAFMPVAFSTAAHGSNILIITCILIIPAFILEFIALEVAWAYLKTTHRIVHVHPYVFFTTVASLLAIGLLENGVFDFGVFIYYFFLSHALSMGYAAIVFFAHFNKQSENSDIDLHTLLGHVVVCAAVLFLVFTGASPVHPTVSTHCFIYLTWVLPWIYVAFVYGCSFYVEHLMENMKGEDADRIEAAKHIYFVGNASVVVFIIGFYTLRLWHVTFGYTTLSNAAKVFDPQFSQNFALTNYI